MILLILFIYVYKKINIQLYLDLRHKKINIYLHLRLPLGFIVTIHVVIGSIIYIYSENLSRLNAPGRGSQIMTYTFYINIMIAYLHVSSTCVSHMVDRHVVCTAQ